MPVNQIIASMQELFLQQSRTLSRSSGFCRRRSRLSASAWVQGLVFGWLSNPRASVGSLARTIAVAGSSISAQAVQQRFSVAGAALLRGVLESLTPAALGAATEESLGRGELAWLQEFPALWLRDSTLITLPVELQNEWPSSGGAMGPSAALKVSVRWELKSGRLAPLQLAPGIDHDRKVAKEQDALAFENGHRILPGEMHLFDLGYFDLRWLAHLHAQKAYFCCRYKAGTRLQRMDESLGSPVNLPVESPQQGTSLQDWLDALPQAQEQVEWPVLMGRDAQLPVRFVAVRVPEEVAQQLRDERIKKNERKRRNVSEERLELLGWKLYVTNAPASRLNAEQVRVLYRVRWQIERLFRLWKETLEVDCWRTKNPQRILCEIYAKLIGAMLTQKLTAFCLWHDPARSLVKCAQTIASHAVALLIHLRSDTALRITLQALKRACRTAARIESRDKKPSTAQRLKYAFSA